MPIPTPLHQLANIPGDDGWTHYVHTRSVTATKWSGTAAIVEIATCGHGCYVSASLTPAQARALARSLTQGADRCEQMTRVAAATAEVPT